MMYTIIPVFFIVLQAHTAAASDMVAPGVFYKNATIKKPKQSVHIMIVDPSAVDIMIGIAHNRCASAEKTTDLAKRYDAIAAINGGFFDFGCKNRVYDIILQVLDCLGYARYKAFPLHMLKKKSHYYSLSHYFTGAIGWNSSDQKPSFGIIQSNATLIINDTPYDVGELNKPYPIQPTLYSRCYGFKTPLLSPQCSELIIENNLIKKIVPLSSGKTNIPANGWVYVIPNNYKQMHSSLNTGDTATVQFSQHPHDTALLSSCDICSKDYILAGTPLLIFNNHIPFDIYHSSSSFYTQRHPRSAVGVLHDGKWVFVVVDGRQRHSTGFTMRELALFMKKLGCTNALNLDGGGSSTLVIHNQIVNVPSGREYSLSHKERPVSNALLICPPKSQPLQKNI